MRFVLGRELQRIREYVACPQLGDKHYGRWGALLLEERIVIARMVETIEWLDKELEKKMYQSPIEFVERPKEEVDDGVFRAVAQLGIKVDKQELLRALAYDREQYAVGYSDGFKHGKVVADAEKSEGVLHRFLVIPRGCGKMDAVREQIYDIEAEAIERFAARVCEGRVANDPVVIAVETELKAMRGAANSYKAEVERLKKENRLLSRNADTAFQDGLNEAQDLYKEQIKSEVRAEAIKEFAERMKEIIPEINDTYIEPMVEEHIDSIVKEMAGDNNG